MVVTKELPGTRWLDQLLAADAEVHISNTTHILTNAEIIEAIGTKCDGLIGQLTENWGGELFEALKQAGGKVYANYAVGYNNVDVPEATKRGIAVGNTPDVLTETTARLARPVENHKVNAELIFAAIHAKSFDQESDIQVQVRAWIFHFDCFFDSD